VSTGRSIHAVPSITPSPREGIEGWAGTLMAAKRRSEDFSDLIIRMAKAEAMASSRLPVALAYRA
jgi:hypothetical protein